MTFFKRCKRCTRLISALKALLNDGYCDDCRVKVAIAFWEQLADKMIEKGKKK